jgi:hypothetical protein
MPATPGIDADPEHILARDGDATMIVRDSGLPGGMLLTIIDGGGFTGILVHDEAWEQMKIKVDAFLAEKKKNNG